MVPMRRAEWIMHRYSVEKWLSDGAHGAHAVGTMRRIMHRYRGAGYRVYL